MQVLPSFTDLFYEASCKPPMGNQGQAPTPTAETEPNNVSQGQDPKPTFSRVAPFGARALTPGPVTPTYGEQIDIDLASKRADDKRRRNAAASAKFRQRKRERQEEHEKEQLYKIQSLNTLNQEKDKRIRELEIECAFYLNELKQLRSIAQHQASANAYHQA